jgi:hypothetical protein
MKGIVSKQIFMLQMNVILYVGRKSLTGQWNLRGYGKFDIFLEVSGTQGVYIHFVEETSYKSGS